MKRLISSLDKKVLTPRVKLHKEGLWEQIEKVNKKEDKEKPKEWALA